MPFYDDLFEGPDSKWTPTCGFQRPVSFATASLCIIQPAPERKSFNILTGVRATDARWEAGMRVLTFGGFPKLPTADKPGDSSIYATALREATREEVGRDIQVFVNWDDPFQTGPTKNRWFWDRPNMCAVVDDGKLCQDIAINSQYFLAVYLGGTLRESDEVIAPHWVRFEDVSGWYAFDDAQVLGYFLPRIKASLSVPY